MSKRNKKIAFGKAMKHLATSGFKPNQSSLNGRVLGGLTVYILNLFTNVMFLVLEANTFWEYTNSFFVSMVATVGLLLFSILINNVPKLFKLMKFAQKVVEDRK